MATQKAGCHDNVPAPVWTQWDYRTQEPGPTDGAVIAVATADGIAILAWRAACLWSGSRSPSCPTDIIGNRVSTSCRYAHCSATECRLRYMRSWFRW